MLIVDLGINLIYVKPLPSRGLAVLGLKGCCQRWGEMEVLTIDNAKEFLEGEMGEWMGDRSIKPNPAPSYSPNKSPPERWIGIITEGARSMLYIAGMDPTLFWSDAVEARAEFQLVMASKSDPTTAKRQQGLDLLHDTHELSDVKH